MRQAVRNGSSETVAICGSYHRTRFRRPSPAVFLMLLLENHLIFVEIGFGLFNAVFQPMLKASQRS